jgi:glycosyltransferase involved in cell wall biosynthesis
MSSAAIYFHPDGFDTTRSALLGRHSAGESFLRGFLRHSTAERFHMLNALGRPLSDLNKLLTSVETTTKDVVWHQTRLRLGDVGVLNLPVPGLNDEAWIRLPLGEGAYAICGITHTTATATIMRTLGDFLTAPLHDYDALICTSRAVRESVEVQLDGVREHLTAQFGPRRLRSEPQRITIPLGVNADEFATSAADRKAWRERLDIPEDAVVALFVGRFAPRSKMNPALMAIALEKAAKLTRKPLYWVNSGWAGSEKEEAAYHESSRTLCPSVHYRQVDGRPPDVRFSIWSVADLFISFSDNVQETFGLTPVEAMAAGLPCVVTDWNGYRDTVRHAQDGFRIPTYAPGPGDGRDLAYAFQSQLLAYDNYVGAAGQFTAIDYGAAARAIANLADNPDLRARMGRQAQARAREVFDWKTIIGQYEALWAEQDARRRAAVTVPALTEDPYRPDPFRLFAGYATRAFGPEWRVAVAEGMDWPQAEAVLSSSLAIYSNFHRPTLGEARAVFEHLAALGPMSGAEAASACSPGRRPFIERGLLWMARFGVLELSPGG